MKTWIGTVFQVPPPIGQLGWCKVPNGAYGGAGVDSDLLLPTIVECLSVIILGYIAGALQWITDAEVRGISFFCSNIALLPLIFLNLATLELGSVNWIFVAAILVSKLIIFLLVVAIFGLIHRARSLHTAALYGIFVTQANDFGMAYPLVSSLFGHKHPLYAHYMYLIAPTSLVVVNPLGFALMEGAQSKGGEGLVRRLATVLWGVLRNPIVNVTFFGILANLLLGAAIPDIMYSVLKVLSSAFSASVLFLLGYLCSKPSSSGASQGILGPALLVAVKTLVSPLVTKTVVGFMCWASSDIGDLANYGFLYGMVPTAPIVLFFAQHYSMPTDVIARALATCTFLSGPIIYLMAKMAALDVTRVTEYMNELRFVIFFLSTFSLACVCWMVLTFGLTSRLRELPYKLLTYFLTTLAVMFVGVVLWFKLDAGNHWSLHLQLTPILVGQLAARFWTGLLAAGLLLDLIYEGKYNSLIHQGFLLLGTGIPLIITVFLISTEEPSSSKMVNSIPLFLYGKKEAALTLVVLIGSLLMTMTCLIIYFRLHKDMSCTGETESVKSESVSQEENIKDLCDCSKLDITTSTEELTDPVPIPRSSTIRHAALLVLLCISMILGLMVCIWKFLRSEVTGLFMALEFLDVVLNFGQGIIVFAVYWSDSMRLLTDVNNRLRSWYSSRRSWSLTSLTTKVDLPSKSTCEQFAAYHSENFRRTLGDDTNKTFEGIRLVKWLMAAGLAADYHSAVSYVQALLDGHVLQVRSGMDQSTQFYEDHATYFIS